ncbi:MAG TPA: hypothetical protein VGM06_10495 [Polyangiaceae bacterium]|jgi:hypothetical protein
MALPFNPITVEQTGNELVIRVQASATPVDELVAIERKALKPIGLEYAPVLALAQAGTLRTVWIGRRRFTRRSWLVALADILPAAVDAEPTDDIGLAAAKRAVRKGATR